MATRSAIGYYTEDQKIRAVYCHWDGYLEHNGKLLLENYCDGWETVETLVEGGSISSLGVEVKSTVYHTSRGEPVRVNTFDTEEEFVQEMVNSGCEFFYLYLHDVDHDLHSPHWHYATYDDRNFRPLRDAKISDIELI